MKKTLIVIGHQNYENSFYNKKLAESVKDLSNVTVHVLKENFNVEEEQKLLTQYDNIVLQYPLYWYSFTPLLKSWLDKVFAYGFVYGPNGDKLENKNFGIAVTTSGSSDAYTKEGHNKFTIDELLTPAKAIVNFVRGNMKNIFSVNSCFPEGMPNKISDEELAKKINEYKDFITSL